MAIKIVYISISFSYTSSMTTAQRDFIEVQKRQSTLRGEFNTLRAVETRSAEQDGRLTALDGELTESETEFRTAADALLTEQATVTAPGGEDTEARERRELCVRANVGDVYNSILEKRGATDAQPPRRKRRTGARRTRSRFRCYAPRSAL